MRTAATKYIIMTLMLSIWSLFLTGQEIAGSTKAVIPGGFSGNSHQLPHRNIIKDSDSILLNDSLLIPNQDYALDCRTGEIYFSVRLKTSDTAVAYYRTLPFKLPDKIVYLPLSVSTANMPDSAKVVPGFEPPASQSYSGWLNEKSGQVRFGGSKSLGISAGSGRDFSLEQALQVSIDGQLSPSLKVNAFLSDQNMPLSSSGSTEDLSQIEKVYIKAQGNIWEAVLGDYDLDYLGTGYFQMKRQLQWSEIAQAGFQGAMQGFDNVADATSGMSQDAASFVADLMTLVFWDPGAGGGNGPSPSPDPYAPPSPPDPDQENDAGLDFTCPGPVIDLRPPGMSDFTTLTVTVPWFKYRQCTRSWMLAVDSIVCCCMSGSDFRARDLHPHRFLAAQPRPVLALA